MVITRLVKVAVMVSLLLVGLLLAAGCDPLGGGKRKPFSSSRSEGKELSLLEIGESSLELSENLEDKGLLEGAFEACSRAVWAFEYHRTLTGETPLLLDDAQDRLADIGGRVNSKNTPK